MTCKEFLAQLTDYFDGNVAAEVEAEVRTHMGKCGHCEVVYNTTRKTIEVYQNNEVYELPPSLRDRLCAAIMAKCKKMKKDCSPSGSTE
jgi:predicted anti-sigma-YlaC factor YlaD